MNISKSAGHAEYQWAVKWNRYVLNIVGVWPEEDTSTGTKFRANVRLLVIILTMSFGVLIPTFLELIRSWANTMAMIEALQYSLPCMMSIVKALILWWKKRDLAPIIGMMEDDWVKLKTVEERNVMIRRMLFVRRLNYILYPLMLMAVIETSIVAGFGIPVRQGSKTSNQSKLLPLGGYYLYDVTVSPNYELTFLAQVIGVLACGFPYAGLDTLFGLLMLHFSGQLENLQFRLADMKNCSDFDYAFASNVNEHIRIMRSIDIIDSVFNMFLLFLFSYFAGFICVYGFLAFTIFNKTSAVTVIGLAQLITTLIAITFITCLFCIVGEILLTQSERFYKSVCDYDWDKLEPQKAKNFILLIARASKPLYVTAGKLFPVTMPTFCSLIKMSAGYISYLIATVK